MQLRWLITEIGDLWVDAGRTQGGSGSTKGLFTFILWCDCNPIISQKWSLVGKGAEAAQGLSGFLTPPSQSNGMLCCCWSCCCFCCCWCYLFISPQCPWVRLRQRQGAGRSCSGVPHHMARGGALHQRRGLLPLTRLLATGCLRWSTNSLNVVDQLGVFSVEPVRAVNCSHPWGPMKPVIQ